MYQLIVVNWIAGTVKVVLCDKERFDRMETALKGSEPEREVMTAEDGREGYMVLQCGCLAEPLEIVRMKMIHIDRDEKGVKIN